MELTDELKRAVATAVAGALTEQTRTLVAAMVDTNKPIERRLDAVNEHLRDLNGKVAAHAVQLATGGERMDRFKEDIWRIDRRIYARRSDDKDEATGENRRLTMFHLYLAVACILATVAFLKFAGFLK